MPYRFLILGILAALIVGARCPLRGADASEYEVKAAFLYNFARFVEWPESAFANTNSPIVIGILGTDPFGALIDDSIKAKTAQDRPFSIRRLSTIENLKECHILYVSSSERARFREILKSVEGSSVLTVNEDDRFTRLGGVVNFVLEGNKVKFEINVTAAERARLKINSQLLRVARITRSDPG